MYCPGRHRTRAYRGVCHDDAHPGVCHGGAATNARDAGPTHATHEAWEPGIPSHDTPSSDDGTE